jgi:iron complex outermembrane receptor protein
LPFGGKELTPESSKNTSIGITSKLGKNITITADYYSVKVDDRIVKSQAIPITDPSLAFGSLSFYTNALNTETQGLDLVTNIKLGDTRISLAYNYNQTKVISQNQVNGVNPVNESGIFNLENNLPKNRFSLSLGHNFGKFDASARANYFGTTFDERSQREEIEARTLIDLDFSYQASENVQLILGAINVFDTYPNEVETRASQGMPFPRRTPIGYSGGQFYFKAIYKFN